MADQVILTADRNNVEDVMDLASEFDLGIELMAFAYPDVLDGSWEHELSLYRMMLRRLRGPLTMHGPFMDMVSGSPDAQINEICASRYRHAMHIASDLGAEVMVLHPNFIGSLHNVTYREGWHKRNVEFWGRMAQYAEDQGVVIALENMWEFEPSIIADLLREIDHPNLKACLDTGHAHVFGEKNFSTQDWIEEMKPWLVHTHMNNNNGILDEHHGFDWQDGVLDYHHILKDIRKLDTAPNIVLEMWDVKDMRDSLHYFEFSEDKSLA